MRPVNARRTVWFLFVIAVACRDAPPIAERPASLSSVALLWDYQIETSVVPGGGWPCPAGIGLAFALATVAWPFRAGDRPHIEVAVGCQASGGCTTVHAAVGLVVTSLSEPATAFEGAAVEAAGCAPWPLSLWHRTLATARAVRSALTLAHGQYRLLYAPDSEVLEVIEQGHPRTLLLQALVVAGDRRLRGAVPMLIRLLDSEDSDVVIRVIGALGRIRDPEALRPLGRLALAQRPELPYAALQAIADIGGDEARRVLELVVEQAPSPVVVREARDLLRGIESRERTGAREHQGKGE